MRTVVVILTWNRIKGLKNTLSTFKKYNPDVKNKNIIIVDNGSTDGTREFLEKTYFDVIFNKVNLGAQTGKYIGWNRALRRGFDFIIFIEDDNPCYRTVPIKDLEDYLDKNKDIGIVRLNDKKYLKRHQITRLPIEYYPKEKLNDNFEIFKCRYHFTSNPSIFRTSLIPKLSACIYPSMKPKTIDIKKLDIEKYRNDKKYSIAIERSMKDFGVTEKEYMRLYLHEYNLTAQIDPPCFKIVIKDRREGWKN